MDGLTRQELANDLQNIQKERDRLDPKDPEEVGLWHRKDAIAAYINSCVCIIDAKNIRKWSPEKIKRCMKCGSPMSYIYGDEDIRRYSCQDEKCGQIEDIHTKGATLCPNNQVGFCTVKCCFDSDGEWHWYYCGARA